MSTGNKSSVEIRPINTPFAITIPKSFPSVKLIVHSTKKPAIVVKLLPITEVNVSSIALDIASSLDLYNSFFFSKQLYKNIEKSVVTPSCKTATKVFVI